MKQCMKREWINRLLLLIIPMLFIVYVWYSNGVYGSETDWISQHIVFPDYFRTMFYETGKLFPDFSLNLGAGQNFAQYTYYGLLRPDVLISFVLPQVKMATIIMISSIIYVLLSVQLMYSWLKRHVNSSSTTLIVSLLFAFAIPLMFHSHRHIMFISYFPGLLLCLIGTDIYIDKKKTLPLVAGVFLMIITSYFFSVAGLVVVGLYGIYAWVNTYPQGSWRAFFQFILRYIGYLLLGILLSAFYLVPTAFAMLLQTRPALSHPSLMELLLPMQGLNAVLYDDYNLGLTAISVVSLLYGIVKKNKASRILSIFLFLILMIPLFSYILNGMQYVRAKSLIPFIPLVLLLSARMLEDVQKKEMQFPWWIFLISLVQALFMHSDKLLYAYLVDLVIVCFLFLIVKKTHAVYVMGIYILIPIFVLLQVTNTEKFAEVRTMKKINNPTKTELIQQTLNKHPGFYRFDDTSSSLSANRVEDARQYKTSQYSSNSNIAYNNFYYNVIKQPMLNRNHVIMASTTNPYFSWYMGVRFVYNQGKKKENQFGYQIIEKKGNSFVQENKDVMPIAYVSYDLMSEAQFQKISYPHTLEALYMNTIVDKQLPKKTYPSSINRIYPEFTVLKKSKGLKIVKTANGMRIKSEKNHTKLKLALKKPLLPDQMLIMKMDIADIKLGDRRDSHVQINGIMNKKIKSKGVYASKKADFEYILPSEKGLHTLDIDFSKGEYTLKNFQLYTSHAELLRERKHEVTPLKFKEQAGSILAGSVKAKKDGYFVTTIPFQKGLQVFVDGKETKIEKVNTAFVGVPVKKGKHQIVIQYTMPGKTLGMAMSGGAILIVAGIWVFKRKKGLVR